MADSIHQSPVTDHFQRLCDIVAKLRAPGGCPWDREQTNETLLPPLIEEAYEAAGGSSHDLARPPAGRPAVMRDQKGQKKAARVNFDWADLADGVAKIEEEIAETKAAIATDDPAKIADELGDLLFAVVNLVRKSGLDAESALQAATDKFVGRFTRVEDELRTRGKKLGEVGLEELDEIWN